jgi:FeS assembly SUF system protein
MRRLGLAHDGRSAQKSKHPGFNGINQTHCSQNDETLFIILTICIRKNLMENDSAKTDLKHEIIKALQTCYDPEIPVNIYELGLVYDINLDASNNALVHMTLTSPACPVAGILPGEVENKIKAIPGVNGARVEVIWEPQWHPGMMSEAAKLELGFM